VILPGVPAEAAPVILFVLLRCTEPTLPVPAFPANGVAVKGATVPGDIVPTTPEKPLGASAISCTAHLSPAAPPDVTFVTKFPVFIVSYSDAVLPMVCIVDAVVLLCCVQRVFAGHAVAAL